MILEPVPAAPRGRLASILRRLGIGLPPLLLVAAVAGGLAGRTDDVVATPDPVAAPSGDPAPAPAADGPGARAAAVMPASWFPERIHGLDVVGPAQALAMATAGDVGGVLFVAGYLSVDALPPACADVYLGPSGARCPRTAVLAAGPRSPLGPDRGWTAVGPHLHPVFPPGVRWPWRVASSAPDAAGVPIPVVALGRFGDPRAVPCETTYRTCAEAFVVERVVWMEGSSYGMTTTIDDTLRIDILEDPWRERRDTARRLLHGEASLLVMTALLAPATLPQVDTTAAEALAAAIDAGAPRPTAVWYIRGLDMRERTGGGLRGTARWVVVDDATGEVLARDEAVPRP